MTRIAVTLREDQYTFIIISRSFFLRIKNIWDKSCKENQNTHFVFNNLFRESCLLLGNVEQYCRAGQATDDNMVHAHSMLVPKATNTP